MGVRHSFFIILYLMIYIFGEHVLYKKKKMFSLYKRFSECPPQFLFYLFATEKQDLSEFSFKSTAGGSVSNSLHKCWIFAHHPKCCCRTLRLTSLSILASRSILPHAIYPYMEKCANLSNIFVQFFLACAKFFSC